MLVVSKNSNYIDIFNSEIDINKLKKAALVKNNFFYDCFIGEFFDEDIFNKDEYVVINSNIETINAYVVDYNEDMDVLVFRFFTMDISFPKYKEDKHWEYLPDYTTIIDKYCNAFVKDYNLISPVRMLFKNFYVGPFMFFNIGNTRQTYTILNNFFGATMPQDEGLFYSSYYIISHLFKYFYERCSLESNIITEEIFNFSLKNIENDIKQEMVDIFLQHCWRDKKYGFVQNVTEGTSVIRVFYLITPPYYDSSSLNNDYNIDDFKVQEIYRFYINHNECFIFRNVCNNWYSVDINKITKDDLYFYLLNNFDENVINNCKLKYFKDILSEAELIYKQDDFNKNSKIARITRKVLLSLLIPSFESLLKNNYERLINYFFMNKFNDSCNLLDSLKFHFGEIDYSQTNFFKAIGISKRLFDVVYQKVFIDKDNYLDRESYTFIFCHIKHIFKENISCVVNMNNNDLNDFLDKFLLFYNCQYHENVCDISISYINNYGCHRLSEFFDWCHEFIGSDEDFAIEYLDYLQMQQELREEVGILPWKFKDSDDFEQAFENISILYNNISNEEHYEEQNKKIELLKHSWDKFLYNNEEFTIIYPQTVQDIAKEGVLLHHCVQSYIDDVVDEKTIILFIRKIDDINTPFYTLEIKNNKIRQCHGLRNCNTDEVNGLDAFIQKFCENKKIVYCNGNAVLANL